MLASNARSPTMGRFSELKSALCISESTSLLDYSEDRSETVTMG